MPGFLFIFGNFRNKALYSGYAAVYSTYPYARLWLVISIRIGNTFSNRYFTTAFIYNNDTVNTHSEDENHNRSKTVHC